MKKTIKLISFLLAALFLLSSCQSIYNVPLMPPEITVNPNIDLSGEYYTTGAPYYNGDKFDGLLYEGCLIFVEMRTTTGVVGYGISAEGVKTERYGDVEIHRIVKYNPVTGIVSSPCLNPACNHSFESGCPMLLGYRKNREPESYVFKGIFGDWLIYVIEKRDVEYTALITEIMYNLKTGETRNIYIDDLGSELISRWFGGYYFEGKYYKINSIMDYSNTGYTPGSGQSISDFDPVTKRYLYEYDFESNTSKKLFEIGEDWTLGKVSNERFYFRKDDGTHISLKKDGTGEKQEVKIDAANLVGTYTIRYNTQGYTIHDLLTDKTRDVTFDYSLIGVVNVTEKGILSVHQTKYDEWKNFPFSQYREEHPELSSEEINNEARKILASGTAQIWQCGYMGEDNHVIFELPAAYIRIISAYGDYIFATLSKYNTETGEHLEGYDNITCSINIKTGEITPIPELEIVVPYWYTN